MVVSICDGVGQRIANDHMFNALKQWPLYIIRLCIIFKISIIKFQIKKIHSKWNNEASNIESTFTRKCRLFYFEAYRFSSPDAGNELSNISNVSKSENIAIFAPNFITNDINFMAWNSLRKMSEVKTVRWHIFKPVHILIAPSLWLAMVYRVS